MMIKTSENLPMGRLLANLGRTHGMRIDQLMEQIGLYRGQAILLLTLAEQNGLTHGEIAERLCISPAAASKVIKRMEGLGYVQRTTDPTDERVSRVYLLDGGRAKLDDIHAVFHAINARMLKDFSPEEHAALHRMLLRMTHNLQNS
ncbi:MAG TPA: MarR family transcriptional regulator [Anaerolineales bacterium]|nr:MarR family transcriptional regulator [Anaerolineales bacterium]